MTFVVVGGLDWIASGWVFEKKGVTNKRANACLSVCLRFGYFGLNNGFDE